MANAKQVFKAAHSLARKEREELNYLSGGCWGELDDEAFEQHLGHMMFGRPEVAQPSFVCRAIRAVTKIRCAPAAQKLSLAERLAKSRADQMPWDESEAYEYN